MAKLFTSRLLLTSNADLLSYLKQHPRLYNLIANGEYIMNYDKLDSLENNFVNTGKYAIIINTLHSSTPPEITGHWVVLLIEITQQNRYCMFVDSLANNYKQHKDLATKINLFCNIHKLNLHLWKARTQKNNSSNCGFQIVFFLFHFNKHGIKGMYRLQSMLQQYSLTTREYYILKRAHKICK